MSRSLPSPRHHRKVAAVALISVAGLALSACAPSAAPDTDPTEATEFTLEDNPLRGTVLTGTFQPDWGLPLAAMVDDKPAGFVIEIAQAAAAKLGATIEVIPNDFATTIPGVQSGKYDIGNGTDATVERQAVVDVVSTTKTGYTFLTYGDLHEPIDDEMDALCGLSISQIAGNSVLDVLNEQNTVCAEEGLEPIDIQIFPDRGAAFLAVQSGRVDATSVYGASGGYIAKEDPKWVVSGPTVISGETGFSVRKDTGYAELWKLAVDAVIADGTYAEILDSYGIGFIALDESTINPAK